MNLYITVSDDFIDVHSSFLDNNMIVCFSHKNWEATNEKVIVNIIPENMSETSLINDIIPETILSLIYDFESVIVTHPAIFMDDTRNKHYIKTLQSQNSFEEEYTKGYTKSFFINKLFKNELNFLLPRHNTNEQYKGEAMLGQPVPDNVIIELLEEIVFIKNISEFSHSENNACDLLSKKIHERYKKEPSVSVNSFVTSNYQVLNKTLDNYESVILVQPVTETINLEYAKKKFVTNSKLMVIVYSKN